MGGGGKTTVVQAPQAPNYQESMRSILQAQVEMAPQVYAQEAIYQPLYAQLQARNQQYLGQQALEQAAQMYPRVAQIEAQYDAANRAAELEQLQKTLPQYQAAFSALTPGYKEALESTGQLAQQSMARALQAPQLTAYEQQVAGPQAGQFIGQIGGPQMRSGLGQINQNIVGQYVNTMPGMQDYANFLAQSSRRELEAGRGLTEEEQRIADQAARSAFAARGTALGAGAVGAEILNRAQVANQRYQERLANAQRAAGQIQAIYQPALAEATQRQQAALQYGLGAQQQAFQQAMGREELQAGTQQAAFQQALARGQAEQQRLQAGTAIQAGQAQLGAGALGQLQQAQAPVLQAFYKQPILQGQVGGAQALGMQMQQQAGPQYFNPESQTGMGSIYGAYNAQMNLAGAQAQANAAAKAGKSSMMGAIGGALIGNVGKMITAGAALCWVAREVYGEDNPKWMQFREWMINDADPELRAAYIQHGPKVAEFISDKPELKSMIRAWMDSKIS